MKRRAERTNQLRAVTKEAARVDPKAIAGELNLIRMELARIGIHFAIAQSDISRASRSDYSEDLRAYGKAIDRMQFLVSELLNRQKRKDDSQETFWTHVNKGKKKEGEERNYFA